MGDSGAIGTYYNTRILSGTASVGSMIGFNNGVRIADGYYLDFCAGGGTARGIAAREAELKSAGT